MRFLMPSVASVNNTNNKQTNRLSKEDAQLESKCSSEPEAKTLGNRGFAASEAGGWIACGMQWAQPRCLERIARIAD